MIHKSINFKVQEFFEHPFITVMTGLHFLQAEHPETWTQEFTKDAMGEGYKGMDIVEYLEFFEKMEKIAQEKLPSDEFLQKFLQWILIIFSRMFLKNQ